MKSFKILLERALLEKNLKTAKKKKAIKKARRALSRKLFADFEDSAAITDIGYGIQEFISDELARGGIRDIIAISNETGFDFDSIELYDKSVKQVRSAAIKISKILSKVAPKASAAISDLEEETSEAIDFYIPRFKLSNDSGEAYSDIVSMVSNGCLELSDSMSDVVGYFNDAIASLRKLKTKESSAMVSVLEPLIRSLATVPNAIAREADEADDIAKEYLADEDDSEMDGSQAGMY